MGSKRYHVKRLRRCSQCSYAACDTQAAVCPLRSRPSTVHACRRNVRSALSRIPTTNAESGSCVPRCEGPLLPCLPWVCFLQWLLPFATERLESCPKLLPSSVRMCAAKLHVRAYEGEILVPANWGIGIVKVDQNPNPHRIHKFTNNRDGLHCAG